MPKGFFHTSELLAMSKQRPVSSSPRCELCLLYKGCSSPKMPPVGRGRRGILIVAESPGKTEDERNEQLIGRVGDRLRSALKSIDVDLDRDCWKTNAIRCHPPKSRTPTHQELGYCRPYLVEAIETYKPHTIITLGDTSLRQVIDPYWDLDFGQFTRWPGYRIPLQPLNTWVCPTWHPSFIEHLSDHKKEGSTLLAFEKHLQAAFELGSPPWSVVPNYKSLVERVDGDVSSILNEMKSYQGMAAFDYETNTLKPDSSESTIVSASIAWGRGKTERCVAYPMTPENERATKEFLQSPIPKLGANTKFEIRWSLTKFGIPGRNWFWDTMQAAHVIDNRQGVCSNDFQAFVRLGLPPYSSHIKPMLKADGTETTNQIMSEISLPHLLMYNGLDSVSEFEIAVKQMKLLGQKPPRKGRC